MSKNILITGITGFVGPHLARSYIEDGDTVYGLVRRRSDGDISRGIRDLGIDGQVAKIEGDVDELASILMAFDEAEPDIVFHLAAQSFVQRSFSNPIETMDVNCAGTANVLEAMRLKAGEKTRLIFAGSSEEYGFVSISKEQVKSFEEKHCSVFPPPEVLPELPIKETNPLRPMSPYAVTKVCGEHMVREYASGYGLNNVVSRGFNHEGARRGSYFVTSVVARQVASIIAGERGAIKIGNVSTFRDWTHVQDTVSGYKLLGGKAKRGEIYNIGSERMNSVLGYILLCVSMTGRDIREIATISGSKRVKEPAEERKITKYGKKWECLKIEEMMLNDEISFEERDRGLRIVTDTGEIRVNFDRTKFRPTDVPYLLSDTKKIRELGFKVTRTLSDIANEQLNYYIDAGHRKRAAPI